MDKDWDTQCLRSLSLQVPKGRAGVSCVAQELDSAMGKERRKAGKKSADFGKRCSVWYQGPNPHQDMTQTWCSMSFMGKAVDFLILVFHISHLEPLDTGRTHCWEGQGVVPSPQHLSGVLCPLD